MITWLDIAALIAAIAILAWLWAWPRKKPGIREEAERRWREDSNRRRGGPDGESPPRE